MFILMICRSDLNLGHLCLKNRSPGQIKRKAGFIYEIYAILGTRLSGDVRQRSLAFRALLKDKYIYMPHSKIVLLLQKSMSQYAIWAGLFIPIPLVHDWLKYLCAIDSSSLQYSTICILNLRIKRLQLNRPSNQSQVDKSMNQKCIADTHSVVSSQNTYGCEQTTESFDLFWQKVLRIWVCHTEIN